MKKYKQKLLLVTAHPDDDTMIGGTLLKLANKNWGIFEFVCTRGAAGKPNKNEKQIHMSDNRKSEIAFFTKEIGVEPPFLYNNQGKMLSINDEIVLTLVEYMRKIVPDVIVLLNSEDYHFEHRLAYEIGLRSAEIAFRSSRLELGPKLKNGIILAADGLNLLSNPFIYFNTSETQKKASLITKKAYGERLGELLQFSEGLAKMRGGRVGYASADAFILLNPQWYKLSEKSAEILQKFISAGS